MFVSLIALGVHANLAADKDNPRASSAEVSVRMRFVPGGPSAKGGSRAKRGQGA